MIYEPKLGAEPIKGIRIFELDWDTLELKAIGLGIEAWVPGEIKRSNCKHAKAHGYLKPEEDCTCGIWSCKSRKGLQKVFPADMMKSYRQKPGDKFSSYYFSKGTRKFYYSAQIEIWGKVIQHQYGYRSEYARIIPQTITVYPRMPKPVDVKLVKLLRKKYGGEK